MFKYYCKILVFTLQISCLQCMNMISDEVKNERKLLVEALLNHLKNEIKVDAEGEVALSNYLTNEVVEIEAAKALVVGLREDKNQLGGLPNLALPVKQYDRLREEEEWRRKIIIAKLEKMKVDPRCCDVVQLVNETEKRDFTYIEKCTESAALKTQIYNRLIDSDNIDIKNKRKVDDGYALWAKENSLLPLDFQFYYERQLRVEINMALQNLLHKENFESLRHQAILAGDIPKLINIHNTYLSLKNKKEQSPL